MKECKCGKIPPCYGSLERALYEEAKKVNDEWKKSRARHGKIIDKLRGKLMEGGFSDYTHDKVYELNKQMCDLGKTMNDPFEPLSEEAIQEIAKALEITRKPKGIIMEKKMNPMTKAEAFEYLKGKKVYANGKGKEVQMKLFECGVSWATNHFVYYDFGDYLLIETDGYLYHCGHEGDSYWRAHHFKEISADDILSIEIVDEKKDDERKGEILDEIAKLGEKISDLIEEYDGDIIIEIDQYEVLLRNSGDILYRK